VGARIGQLLLVDLPMLIVSGIGLWFVSRGRLRHARASLLACIGFISLAASTVLRVVMRVVLILNNGQFASEEPARLGRLLFLWSGGTYLLFVTAIGLIVSAAFVGREAPVAERAG
jgi:hypothetical protein